MQSIVSVKGQTVIPKAVREALGIKRGDRVAWVVQNGRALLFRAPDDPVKAMRGVLKGMGSTEELLAERRADLEKDEASFEAMVARWRSSS